MKRTLNTTINRSKSERDCEFHSNGPKWFIAHSLGNMLVSAAIQDYGMPHEKYFMLNAAVAMEAFDPTNGITQASHDNMTPEAWTNYTDRVRATHWFERFPEGDGRRLLTWKGRFCNVTNIVNFYSTQEEVVCNGDGRPKDLGRKYSWYNQECYKGNWAWMLHDNEGGWVFNRFYDTVTNPDPGNKKARGSGPSVYVLLYMLDCVAQQVSTSGLRMPTTRTSSLRRGSC